MVESTKSLTKNDEDDFEEMLTMNTDQQQIRNTLTFPKLRERFHTSFNLEDDSIVDTDKEFQYPTLFAHDTRSYMSKSMLKDEIPVYDSKIIHIFGEKYKVGLKKFLENNPNLECLIKIVIDKWKY